MKTQRTPSHPGGILKRLYLEPLKLTVTDFAQGLKVSRKTASKLVNQKASITPEMALRLSIAFETTPQLWLNLQQSYDLWIAERNIKELDGIRKLAA
jgi:addiction module HigA family antidote